MFDEKWRLFGAGESFDFSARWEMRSSSDRSAALFAQFHLDRWLEDPWSRPALWEMDEALGGYRPWAPTVADMQRYHEAVKARVIAALESGRLQVIRSSTWSTVNRSARAQPKPEPARPLPAQPPELAELFLSVATASGEPVEDDEGFTLVTPDGVEEPAQLTNGCFQKMDIPPGLYRARFKYFRDARWEPESIRFGEEATMRVSTPGFPSGTSVTFNVYELHQPPDATPVAQVQAEVRDGEATATWRHGTGNELPGWSRFVFEVERGQKWISSKALKVELAPAAEIEGLKQRLSKLGFDCGPAGPDSNPDFERALKVFQESIGHARPHGRPDDDTIAVLQSLA